MKSALSIQLWLLLAFLGPAAAQSAPAELISNFRAEHGEGRVTLDSTLTRIARDQAAAMAAKDVLDHDVLGRFSSRIVPANAGRAAENIAYGYDNFPKTLRQWIESSEHRKNLLLHNATRVGIAEVKSPATGRTYWAMEIAGDYEPPKAVAVKQNARTKPKAQVSQGSAQNCRLKILSICF